MHKIIELERDRTYCVNINNELKVFKISELYGSTSEIKVTFEKVLTDHRNEKEINLYNILNTSAKSKERFTTISEIEKVVCNYYDLPVELIRGQDRFRNVVLARHIIMYLAYKKSKFTLREVGLMLNKHHATIIHASKQVRNLYETDKLFRVELEEIESKLNY